ncbi:MAG: hypothetical protein U9R16_07690 [Campylobacterota bacterium]|nr:hypothetical protein [Campylobacterota bacterium]
MVDLYFLIDLVLFIFISFAIYYSYQNKIYIKIFNYFKLFLIITISAKLASFTGIKLERLNIISSDTYTTVVLIGFSLNILIFYYGDKFIFKFIDKFVNSNLIKDYFAKLITVIEVVVITTFTLYILMQLSISKSYIHPTLMKSYSYPYIKKFYIKFLNDDFLNMVLKADTGTNYKEVIFKSFKNGFN